MGTSAIGYNNAVLTATLGASTAQSGLDQNNLKSASGNATSAWQTTSASSQYLTLQTTSLVPTPMQLFSVHRTNLTSTATIQFLVYSDTLGGTLAYDSGSLSGVQPGYQQFIHISPSAINGAAVQVNIDDPSNTDGFISVALCYIGPKFSPTIGFTAQSARSRVVGSTRTTTRSGSISYQQYFAQRQWAIAYSGITYSELWTDLENLDLLCRGGRNVLFIPNTSETAAVTNKSAVFGLCEPSQGIGYLGPTDFARTWGGTVTERL